MVKKVKEIIGINNEVKELNTATPATEVDDAYRARQAGMQTIHTSMRGLLSESDTAPSRKKLLGE